MFGQQVLSVTVKQVVISDEDEDRIVRTNENHHQKVCDELKNTNVRK